MRRFVPLLSALSLVGVASAALAQTPVSFELSQNTAKLGLSGVQQAVQSDFNNDGIPDLLTEDTNSYGQTMVPFSLRLGNGDGTFQMPVQVGTALASAFSTLLTFDVNGDGNLDLVLISKNEISVQFGTGTGRFGTPIVSATSSPGNGILGTRVTGDFNGDGRTDIAGVDGTGDLQIYQNSGNGKFIPARTITPASPGAVFGTLSAGDLDGDGKTDLAVSEYPTTGEISIHTLWGLGNNTFHDVSLRSYPAGQYPAVEAVGDLNQDGSPDIIVEYSCETAPSTIGKGSPYLCAGIDAYYGGQGPQSVFFRHLIEDPTVDSTLFLQTADVNGDGIGDLVGEGEVGNSSQQGLVAWLGKPDGSFAQTAQQFNATSDNAGPQLVVGDFNRDGLPDFLLPGINSGNPNLGTAALFLNATPRSACATSKISPTVVACQPVDNTYISGPNVRVDATAFDKAQVTALQEYIDGKLVYSQPETSANLQFPESLGPHLLVTKAWDANGISFRTNRRITVYDGTPGPVCPATPGHANICLPSEITATSPVHMLANGATSFASNSSSAAIPTAAQLYIDGRLAVNDRSQSTVVDTTQTLAAGTHQLVFKLYDANGYVGTASKTVTVQ